MGVIVDLECRINLDFPRLGEMLCDPMTIEPCADEAQPLHCL